MSSMRQTLPNMKYLQRIFFLLRMWFPLGFMALNWQYSLTQPCQGQEVPRGSVPLASTPLPPPIGLAWITDDFWWPPLTVRSSGKLCTKIMSQSAVPVILQKVLPLSKGASVYRTLYFLWKRDACKSSVKNMKGLIEETKVKTIHVQWDSHSKSKQCYF